MGCKGKKASTLRRRAIPQAQELTTRQGTLDPLRSPSPISKKLPAPAVELQGLASLVNSCTVPVVGAVGASGASEGAPDTVPSGVWKGVAVGEAEPLINLMSFDDSPPPMRAGECRRASASSVLVAASVALDLAGDVECESSDRFGCECTPTDWDKAAGGCNLEMVEYDPDLNGDWGGAEGGLDTPHTWHLDSSLDLEICSRDASSSGARVYKGVLVRGGDGIRVGRGLVCHFLCETGQTKDVVGVSLTTAPTCAPTCSQFSSQRKKPRCSVTPWTSPPALILTSAKPPRSTPLAHSATTSEATMGRPASAPSLSRGASATAT